MQELRVNLEANLKLDSSTYPMAHGGLIACVLNSFTWSDGGKWGLNVRDGIKTALGDFQA